MQQTGNISIHAQNIMPIIKKWLYSDKDIFIRELVSNGCDAIVKRRMAQPDETAPYAIQVTVNAKEGTLRFSDNGIGMTEEEVAKYINQVAFSGAEEFLKQYNEKNPEGSGIIGHFGLGFYSAFMVSKRVIIDTLSFQPNAEAVRWESEDGMSYTMAPSDRTTVGTTITLEISEEEKEFLQLYRVREVLNRYCAFMAIPIFLDEEGKEPAEPEEDASENSEEEITEKAEEDEPKTEDTAPKEPEAPKPINDTQPLWLKDPKQCTEEEYKAFYTKVFHEFEAPLFWVHLNVDYPFNLKGILYFPKLKNDFGSMMEGSIKLFSGQVFVADNIKEVIPEFLTLLKGVIDCPDLPLNVSRSFLQNDGYVKKLSAYITRKVADRLTGLFNTEREAFEKYWEDIHPFIKFGCMKDEQFYDRVKEILLLKLTDDRHVTLAEYLEAMKEKAENKVFYATDVQRQAATISLYREQGMDVALLDTPIDVNFISFLEYKNHDVHYSRVDADLSGLVDQTEDAPALDGTRLEHLFRDALNQAELKVSLEALKNAALPAMVLEDEQSRRFRDMSQMYGGTFAMPESSRLVLNPNNAVVKALAEREANEETLELCRQIYDLAQMARQPLSSDAMSKFIERSNQMLAWLIR